MDTLETMARLSLPIQPDARRSFALFFDDLVTEQPLALRLPVYVANFQDSSFPPKSPKKDEAVTQR